MAKSKALDCAVQCCSSLVSWAVGDAKFFGNEKPNGPATCYWPAIAHLSSLFASISNWKFVWKFNQIQILATWGGHSWNGLTTDKRTDGRSNMHIMGGERDGSTISVLGSYKRTTTTTTTVLLCFANFEMASLGRPARCNIFSSPILLFFATASSFSSRPSCPGHDKFRYATTAQTFSADGYGVTCFIFRTA
jgi:hypothetical protein